MIKSVYLYNKKSTNGLLKMVLILLIFPIIMGIYKNSFHLLKNDLSILIIIKPLIFLGLSLLTSIAFVKIKKESFLSYRLLCNILIFLMTMPNTNIIFYIVILILLNIFFYKDKFNMPSLYMLLAIIFSFILKEYTFSNALQLNNTYSYEFMDILLGRNACGMGCGSIIFSILSFLVLTTNMEYKKELPITFFILYYVLILGKSLIFKDFSLDLILNNNLIFAIIFLLPISIYSPYTKGACIIFSSLLAIFVFIFSFWDINIGVYLGIFILSFLKNWTDKIITNTLKKS